MKKIIRVPFDDDGNQMGYGESCWGQELREWKDNYEFEEPMQILTYSRGRSSVKIIVKSSNY